MTTETAAGPISLALEVARAHLAACTSYQAFLGVTGTTAAAQAVAKTYLAALPVPEDESEYTPDEWESVLRPFGMVYTASVGGLRLTRSAAYAVSESGRMFIELEITIPTSYVPSVGGAAIDLTVDKEAADRWINNKVGQIADEFMAKAGQAGYLDASSITLVMGPSREKSGEEVTNGYYYWTLLEVVWGSGE